MRFLNGEIAHLVPLKKSFPALLWAKNQHASLSGLGLTEAWPLVYDSLQPPILDVSRSPLPLLTDGREKNSWLLSIDPRYLSLNFILAKPGRNMAETRQYPRMDEWLKIKMSPFGN